MWALAGGLGLSIRFHMRVRVERKGEPRAAAGVGFERAWPSVSFIVNVCVGRRILEMQL